MTMLLTTVVMIGVLLSVLLLANRQSKPKSIFIYDDFRRKRTWLR